MRIVHLCLSGPYTDNWGYQENLLPLYQARAGHKVTIIATTMSHEPGGNLVDRGPGEYTLDSGIHIVRVRLARLLTAKIGFAYAHYRILGLLMKFRPDLIMMHGLLSVTAIQAILYKFAVNRKCVLVADTHLDSYNAPVGPPGMSHSLYRRSISALGWVYAKSCRSLFGITPDCIDYAVKRHGISRERFQLLPLGADMERVDFTRRDELRRSVREKYDIPASSSIIVSGGKLDAAKGIHGLIEAVGSSSLTDITLVLFGSPSSDYSEAFAEDIQRYEDKTRYIGFLSLDEIYSLYLAADLAVFPGTQSALWQQAIACGLPAIFRRWPGIEYLDLGGNCVFVDDSQSGSIRELIECLILDRPRLEEMATVARREGSRQFSYQSLAAQALE